MTDRVQSALSRVDRAYFCVDQSGSQFPQTSAPEMIARMLRALDVETGFRVLEIGTGSGYSTALLAELVGPNGLVVTIDVDPPISERAATLLARRGYANVHVTTADGRRGWPSSAPYDRAVAWCSVSVVPRAWLNQTRAEAILVVPMRTARRQSIGKYRWSQDGRVVEEERFRGAFIPATATPFHPWEQPSTRSHQA